MRRVQRCALILALILVMGYVHATNTAIWVITFQSQTVETDQLITADLCIEGNPGFAGAQLVITYDATRLEYVTCVKGAMVEATDIWFAANMSVEGRIQIALVGLSDLQGDGVVATLQFRALSSGSAAATVEIQQFVTADEVPVQANGSEATVLVSGAEVQPTNSESKSTIVSPSGGAVDGAEEGIRYSDVAQTHWAYEAIELLSVRGVFTGVTPEQFNPNGEVTRGMFVTLLYRCAGQPPTTMREGFLDVPADAWFSAGAGWALEVGVTHGTGPGGFSPDISITREQMAQMLYQFAGAPVGAHPPQDYMDAPEVSDWAVQGMAWAVAQGIITGKPGNRLDPQGTATRAEAAVILERYLSGRS